MDIENHESAILLKESSSRKRQGLALKLAVLLCGLGLLVNLIAPMGTLERALGSSSTFKEEKVTAAAAAGVSSTSRPASTMSMDWRKAAVAAPAWSVEDNDTTRAPFGYCARGGGFRMMSMHMGIARALGGDGWSQVTHIGGASGGYWFGSQIVYSQSFYDKVLDASLPVEDLLTDWGEGYAQAQLDAVAAGEAWAKRPTWDEFLPDFCKPLAGSFSLLFGGLARLGLPISNWGPYIANMMLPTIDDIATARYRSRNATGLTTATLIGQVSVPPEAFLTGAGRVGTRNASYDGVSDPEQVTQALIPAAYVVPEGAPDGSFWTVNDKLVGPMTATVEGEPTQAILQENPYLLEVIGASSSAGGYTAVPTWTDNIIQMSKLKPRNKLLAKSCKPFGLESLATEALPSDFDGSLMGKTTETLDDLGSAAVFRLVDGGYTENQGAASTLAEMQKTSDGPIKLLLVTNSNYSTTPLFADGPEKYLPNGQRNYENNYSIPVNSIGGRYDGIVGGFFVPGAQIFNESYPGREEDWPIYASSTIPTKLDFEALLAEEYKEIDSVYWHGVMGSVENEWYGTTAGSIVDVLIVQSNYPEGLEGVPVIVPARGAKWAFSEIYGRLAALQAAGAAPVIQAWLAGELPLTSFP